MTAQINIPTLASLEYLPYLDEAGQISENFQKKIGVYAIFDRDRVLQAIAYSRDIYLGLKQHLIRQPERCYWLKHYAIERPSRTILEEIQAAWIAENGVTPSGNDAQKSAWHDPIDAKVSMTEEEKELYTKSEDKEKIKLLKTVARRVEAELKEKLQQTRNTNLEMRFNPKLKEKGLLDLK
ncbi:MAG: GIY-YIG nuclease family protein [Cyanobacteria bacterium P01_E01_bin.42]